MQGQSGPSKSAECSVGDLVLRPNQIKTNRKRQLKNGRGVL